MLMNAAYDRAGTGYGFDKEIEGDHANVEKNLGMMRDFYGEE